MFPGLVPRFLPLSAASSRSILSYLLSFCDQKIRYTYTLQLQSLIALYSHNIPKNCHSRSCYNQFNQSHIAGELQQHLHSCKPSQNKPTWRELLQTGWVQVESLQKTLSKFPDCTLQVLTLFVAQYPPRCYRVVHCIDFVQFRVKQRVHYKLVMKTYEVSCCFMW